jgi:hypothetical protein
MAKVLASLTVLLSVAAMLHDRFFDARRSFRISYLSDVNDRIRDLHGKVFFRCSIQIQALLRFIH